MKFTLNSIFGVLLLIPFLINAQIDVPFDAKSRGIDQSEVYSYIDKNYNLYFDDGSHVYQFDTLGNSLKTVDVKGNYLNPTISILNYGLLTLPKLPNEDIILYANFDKKGADLNTIKFDVDFKELRSTENLVLTDNRDPELIKELKKIAQSSAVMTGNCAVYNEIQNNILIHATFCIEKRPNRNPNVPAKDKMPFQTYLELELVDITNKTLKVNYHLRKIMDSNVNSGNCTILGIQNNKLIVSIVCEYLKESDPTSKRTSGSILEKIEFWSIDLESLKEEKLESIEFSIPTERCTSVSHHYISNHSNLLNVGSFDSKDQITKEEYMNFFVYGLDSKLKPVAKILTIAKSKLNLSNRTPIAYPVILEDGTIKVYSSLSIKMGRSKTDLFDAKLVLTDRGDAEAEMNFYYNLGKSSNQQVALVLGFKDWSKDEIKNYFGFPSDLLEQYEKCNKCYPQIASYYVLEGNQLHQMVTTIQNVYIKGGEIGEPENRIKYQTLFKD